MEIDGTHIVIQTEEYDHDFVVALSMDHLHSTKLQWSNVPAGCKQKLTESAAENKWSSNEPKNRKGHNGSRVEGAVLMLC